MYSQLKATFFNLLRTCDFCGNVASLTAARKCIFHWLYVSVYRNTRYNWPFARLGLIVASNLTTWTVRFGTSCWRSQEKSGGLICSLRMRKKAIFTTSFCQMCYCEFIPMEMFYTLFEYHLFSPVLWISSITHWTNKSVKLKWPAVRYFFSFVLLIYLHLYYFFRRLYNRRFNVFVERNLSRPNYYWPASSPIYLGKVSHRLLHQHY